MSVLIVDDFLDARLVLEDDLRDMGYPFEVHSAESALEAFQILGMNGSNSRESPVDLILMDIDMPEIDGVEACRQVKARPDLRNIPIIMVTSHNEVGFLEEAFFAGALDYITKPVNRTELKARVHSALSLKCETDCRKLAYDQLEQESLARTQILSTVTHELPTPMTGIVGNSNMSLAHQDDIGALSEGQEKYLKYVQKDSSILTGLIDDLLDITNIEAGGLKLTYSDIEIQPEIEHVIRSVQNQFTNKNVHLEINIPTDLQHFRLDRLRLFQVLTNLVSNAYKYSAPGATVTIALEADGDGIQINVSDTGMGIAEADQSQLFGKFSRVDSSSTRAVSGIGLGLYITKLLVDAQGGKIWFKSKLGEGSTFSFTLPFVSDVATSDDPSCPTNISNAQNTCC